MSFFDEPKNAGLAMIIVAIINLIVAIMNIVAGATGDDGFNLGTVLVGVGALIGAFIYFKFGASVRSGATSGKVNILATFVKVVGVVTIIDGVFSLVSSVGGGIIGIILGLIIFWCGSKIDDGKETTIDKIIWIILLVVFILSILGSLISVVAFPIGTITGICGIIIYVFMLMLLLDPEVKKAMGM